MNSNEIKLCHILKESTKKCQILKDIFKFISTAPDSVSETFLSYILYESLSSYKTDEDFELHKAFLDITPSHIVKHFHPGLLSHYTKNFHLLQNTCDKSAVFVLSVLGHLDEQNDKILYEFFFHTKEARSRFSLTIKWLYENSLSFKIFYASEILRLNQLCKSATIQKISQISAYLKEYIEKEIEKYTIQYAKFLYSKCKSRLKFDYPLKIADDKSNLSFGTHLNTILDAKDKTPHYKFFEADRLGIVSKETIEKIIENPSHVVDYISPEILVLASIFNPNVLFKQLFGKIDTLVHILEKIMNTRYYDFFIVKTYELLENETNSDDEIKVVLQTLNNFFVYHASKAFHNIPWFQEFRKMCSDKKIFLIFEIIQSDYHMPIQYDKYNIGKYFQLEEVSISESENNRKSLSKEQLIKTVDQYSYPIDCASCKKPNYPAKRENSFETNKNIYGILYKQCIDYDCSCLINKNLSEFHLFKSIDSLDSHSEYQAPLSLCYDLHWILIRDLIFSTNTFPEFKVLKGLFKTLHKLEYKSRLMHTPLKIIKKMLEYFAMPRIQLKYIFDQLLYLDSNDGELRCMILPIFGILMRQFKIQDDYIENRIKKDQFTKTQTTIEQNIGTLIGHKLIDNKSMIFDELNQDLKKFNQSRHSLEITSDIMQKFYIDEKIVTKKDIENFNNCNIYVLAAALSDELLELTHPYQEPFQFFTLCHIISYTKDFLNTRFQDAGIIDKWIASFRYNLKIKKFEPLNTILLLHLLILIIDNFDLTQKTFITIFEFLVENIHNEIDAFQTAFVRLMKKDRFLAHYLIFYQERVNSMDCQNLYLQTFNDLCEL